MGLLDSLCATGEDGEDERVKISIPGVEGDKDRFRLLIESEMGDMVMAICEAVVLVMVLVLETLRTVLLLLLSWVEPNTMELPLA